MAEIASAFVSLLPSAKGFGRGLESQVGGEMRSSGSRLGGLLGKTMKVGLLAGVAGVGAAFVAGLKGAAEYQKIQAQTAAVIKSTGGAAGVTAEHVAKLGSKIEGYSAFGNEAVEEGENLLLTFTGIRNEAGKGNKIFDRATTTITDMATALGTAPKDAALQLGKALNDPVKGVTALQRVGVSFTEQQKSQIKTLVDSGKTMEAQKVILGELNKEFGGSAKAAGQTFAGSLSRLKNLFGDLLRDAVMPLLPALTEFVQKLSTGIPVAAAAVGSAIESIKGFIAPLAAQISALFSGGSGGGIMAGVLSFAATVRGTFLPVLQTMASTFQTKVLPAITALASYLAAKLMPVFAQVAGIVKGQVLPIVAALGQFFYGTLLPAVLQIATAVAQRLKPIFDQLVATFRTSLLPTIEKVLAKFREWQPTLEKVALVVLKVTGFVLKLAASILGKVLPVAIRFAAFLITNVVRAIVAVIDVIVRIISWVIKFGAALVKGVRWVVDFHNRIIALAHEGLGDLVAAVAALPGKITALGGRFLAAGQAIIRQFVEGLRGAGGLVSDIAGNVWDAVRGMLNSAIAKINAALSFTIHLPGPDINVNPPDIPMLAKGGPVSAGRPYIVGEEGPELYVPTHSGRIIPNHKLRSSGGLGGDDAVLAELRAMRKALARVGADVGHEINGAASAGHRRRVA